MNLAEWEKQNADILTSKEMGEWLIKRFTNKNLSALAEVKRRINHRMEKLGREADDGTSFSVLASGKIRGLREAIAIIDEYTKH